MTAYRILHPFTTLSGHRYRRTDFYEPRTEVEADELDRAQFALALEEGSAPPPAPPRIAAPAPAVEEEKESEEEPDWSFQTIKAMRAWLDSSGVTLPSNARSRAPHEDLCHDAWVAGARPHPLYGFPGGPEVAPGLPGPNANDATSFAAALDAARHAEVEIPRAAIEAFEALASNGEAHEGAWEPAGEAIEEDPPGTSNSTNEAVSGAEEAEEDVPDMGHADEDEEE